MRAPGWEFRSRRRHSQSVHLLVSRSEARGRRRLPLTRRPRKDRTSRRGKGLDPGASSPGPRTGPAEPVPEADDPVVQKAWDEADSMEGPAPTG